MPFFLSLFFPSIFHYLCIVNDSSIQPIQKILVANRGEIALRVMRTAKEMGIATVAVYSDADRNASFARYADEAIHIGPAPSSESYLVADKIIDAARSTDADAIHPGYGFLSENAAFAAAVEAAGIRFIGPRPHAIETMGSKLAAKETVKPFDVPLVPGTDHPVHTPQEAREVANRIGYPLLIKASAGGGGKGMRIVREDSELENQILADMHGNVVHLFERECSIQRRHQKVVEEAPSTVLTPELREAMGNSAIEVAKSCDYVGAGTVEFLLDDQMRYYFLEMNTRLQVEHPVTECIANVDLVREQIRIAEGHPLSFSQEELSIRGHAIEIRVYAENARAGFLPDTGTLHRYAPPTGPGVRVDDGVEEGQEIPIHYDPMLSKLVVHAPNRDSAIDRCIRAIDEYEVSGVYTTLDFGRFAIDHEAFRSGKFDTHFVDAHFTPEVLERNSDMTDKEIAALAASLMGRSTPNKTASAPVGAGQSPWLKRAQA